MYALLWIALLCGSAWVFIEVVDEVAEGEARQLDERLLLALRNPADSSDPVGPEWLQEMGRDFTALGGTGVLALITLAAIGYLSLAHRYRAALFTLLAVGGGMLLSTLLKLGFDRPRPELVPHETIVYTTSFPSGHSMMSAVTYLTLAALAALLGRVHEQPALKAYLLGVAMLLTLLTGLSRVYLGVHWPTDILPAGPQARPGPPCAGWSQAGCSSEAWSDQPERTSRLARLTAGKPIRAME